MTIVETRLDPLITKRKGIQVKLLFLLYKKRAYLHV